MASSFKLCIVFTAVQLGMELADDLEVNHDTTSRARIASKTLPAPSGKSLSDDLEGLTRDSFTSRPGGLRKEGVSALTPS